MHGVRVLEQPRQERGFPVRPIYHSLAQSPLFDAGLWDFERPDRSRQFGQPR